MGLCALSKDHSLCCRMSAQDSESEGIVYALSGGVPISHRVPQLSLSVPPRSLASCGSFSVENRVAIEGDALNE